MLSLIKYHIVNVRLCFDMELFLYLCTNKNTKLWKRDLSVIGE